MALWKRALLSLVLVLSAAVALAPSAGPKRTIPRGVRVAGVNMAGLDAGQARQQIVSRFSVPLRFHLRGRRWSVPTARLGLAVSATDAVSQAFRAQSGDNIEVRVEADREKIRNYVETLEERFGPPAEDARSLWLDDGRPAIAAPQWGRISPARDDGARDRAHAQNAHPAGACRRDEDARAVRDRVRRSGRSS